MQYMRASRSHRTDPPYAKQPDLGSFAPGVGRTGLEKPPHREHAAQASYRRAHVRAWVWPFGFLCGALGTRFATPEAGAGHSELQD